MTETAEDMEHHGEMTMLHRRRTFIATGFAFLALTGALSAPALSRPGETPRGGNGRRGNGQGGGRQRRSGPGSGTEGVDRDRTNRKQDCDNVGKAPIRLVLKGKQAWQGKLNEFFDQPGTERIEKGKHASLRTISVAALITNSKRRWSELSLIACNGSEETLNAEMLVQTPERYVIVETRRNFLKLVERRPNARERTLLRDIRTIEMR